MHIQVLVIGGDLAGIAAAGAAKEIGASVRVYDRNAAVRKQAEAVGAEFLGLKMYNSTSGASEGLWGELPPELREAEVRLVRLNRIACARDRRVMHACSVNPTELGSYQYWANPSRHLASGAVNFDLSQHLHHTIATMIRRITHLFGYTVVVYGQ